MKKSDKGSVLPEVKLEAGFGDIGLGALGKWDWIAAPIVFAGLAVWIFFHIYSAINWDDLIYMNLSVHTEGQAWILNRYGHIYLLKIFRLMFFDTILGCRVYWCFMFAVTATLVYWCGKMLAGKRGVVAGAAAVVLVYMQPMFGREAGSPLADFTVMMLVTAGVFIYLGFLRDRTSKSRWLLMAFGLILFWAVKSKETGICLSVLLFGLGRDTDDKFNFIDLLKDWGWVVAGMAVGSFVLMTFDLIFIGDFLFSVRPSNIEKLFGTNIVGPRIDGQRTIQSWFSFLSARPFFVPFILYVISAFTLLKKYKYRDRLVLVMPLFLILFLTFSRKGWYVVPRYICPVLPVMAIWGAQFFEGFGDIWSKAKSEYGIRRDVLGGVLFAGAFVIIAALVAPKVSDWAVYYKLNEAFRGFPHLLYQRLSPEQLFYVLAIMPLCLCGIFAVRILLDKKNMVSLFLVSLFSLGLVLPCFVESESLMKTAERKSYRRYGVLRKFEDDLKFDKDTKILISQSIHKDSWMMGRDSQAHCHMLNIFLGSKLSYDQVIDGTGEDIIKGGYDYAILHGYDTVQLKNHPAFMKLLESYEVKTDTVDYVFRDGDAVPVVLLSKRGGAK